MRNLKNLFFLILLLLVFALGWWGKARIDKTSKTEIEAEVAIGMLQNVLKLATVEQELSEVLTRRQFRSYDWDVFSGKMIYKLQGKVAAGYDLEGMNIRIDSLEKKVTISGMNAPELLYVEADIQFYDITEGLFFEFEEDDYNQIMRIGKQELIKAAKDNGILEQASKKGSEALNHLKEVLQTVGWELELEPYKRLPGFLEESNSG
ncbi:MAG TPA: DUF4230 domain-containing protein [Saprospiraceae bacterium]|nr:DUF4230 domain-containing protein [Saprospiraceae bacterium]